MRQSLHASSPHHPTADPLAVFGQRHVEGEAVVFVSHAVDQIDAAACTCIPSLSKTELLMSQASELAGPQLPTLLQVVAEKGPRYIGLGPLGPLGELSRTPTGDRFRGNDGQIVREHRALACLIAGHGCNCTTGEAFNSWAKGDVCTPPSDMTMVAKLPSAALSRSSLPDLSTVASKVVRPFPGDGNGIQHFRARHHRDRGNNGNIFRARVGTVWSKRGPSTRRPASKHDANHVALAKLRVRCGDIRLRLPSRRFGR